MHTYKIHCEKLVQFDIFPYASVVQQNLTKCSSQAYFNCEKWELFLESFHYKKIEFYKTFYKILQRNIFI